MKFHIFVADENGNEMARIETEDYYLIMGSGDLICTHANPVMVGRVHLLGMGGKVLERIAFALNKLGSPPWYSAFALAAAAYILTFVETVDKTYNVIPMTISQVESDRMSMSAYLSSMGHLVSPNERKD